MIFSLPLMVLVFTLTYYLAERTGLFSIVPQSSLKVLFSIPILTASLLFLVLTLVSAARNFRDIEGRGWLLVLTVILLISGLWISYFTRFSGEVVLTEGQTFYSGHNEYVPETFYRGRFSTVPDIGMELKKLTPSFNDDKNHVEGLASVFRLIGIESDDAGDISITDGIPSRIDGTFLTITDFGYSTRYALKSQEGRVLDSSFIYMKLFPPGSEDSFRLLSPLTYYVRYFPDGDGERKDPTISLRIVRNKDIVFNGHVKLSEDVPFENSRISFEEMRMWTRLSIVHDWGMVAAFCSILPGLLSIVLRGKKG